MRWIESKVNVLRQIDFQQIQEQDAPTGQALFAAAL